MRATIPLMVKPRRPARKVPPLLPPLQLYRRILRGHRKYLPELQRSLGDQYVKAEFHAHKDIDNPLHIVGFLTSWQDYLNAISGNSWREAGLTQQDLDKMSPQQVGQLYELMKETKKVAEQDANKEDLLLDNDKLH